MKIYYGKDNATTQNVKWKRESAWKGDWRRLRCSIPPIFLSLSTLSEAEKALRCLAVFTLTEKNRRSHRNVKHKQIRLKTTNFSRPAISHVFFFYLFSRPHDKIPSLTFFFILKWNVTLLNKIWNFVGNANACLTTLIAPACCKFRPQWPLFPGLAIRVRKSGVLLPRKDHK